jgi:hypothetical protein
MNLSVEHVLMFALVVCALYYLMGKCDCKEGYVDPKSFCENEFSKCVCRGLITLEECKAKVDYGEVDAKGGNKKCSEIDWDVGAARSKGDGAWFGRAPFCDGECPTGWTLCETSRTSAGHECWTGNKVRCANLPQ